MIVHHPQWQRARQMVVDGAIGRVVHITGAFSYDNSDDPQNIRNQAAMGGGGLRDIGVYVLGSARYVMGAELENISPKFVWKAGLTHLPPCRAIWERRPIRPMSPRACIRIKKWCFMDLKGCCA